MELNFPSDFLFLFLTPGQVVSSFPKESRKSGIYPVLLMLTSTPVASVRNPR